ncbi:MAG: hypothetical protein A2600_00560 [Candidatus Lambdaproteobacteria bacterium RIFOXYD1_FULL_56_27]|uniref:Uncharacterized protein n=1 Tax=Candidatus Lambdaproteobacteria bacterium RIFOXYD2_FULL_56_26 TaxID=1817773 RepID=A0A1F6GLT6_9PROT|nr:MAG: hypothetical protein A2557_09960 [Candidatus Lambdaproteobacteria bacterium RIFOXYD2_FULL_56_26]OGH07052.1 MAG: hypothetical protein A2600_00560 [Candidatus Lambdaproteobacteria bacterium RIFOXYD1_FULL_56_27]
MTRTFAENQWEKCMRFCPRTLVPTQATKRTADVFLEGVLWLALSEGNGGYYLKNMANGTAFTNRWQAHGVFERLFSQFNSEADLENLRIDSTVLRAHPCSAGALKK